MDITTEAGASFGKYPRRENKELLLDITIVNPCASSNLENAARHAGNHLADVVERKKNKYRGSFSATYSLLPLAMSRVVRLAQTCMPTSRSSLSDGLSTGRRYTPTSPSIWWKGRK